MNRAIGSGSDAGRYRYSVFGTVLESAIELPELPAAEEDGPAELTIRFGHVPDSLEAPRYSGQFVQTDGARVLAAYPLNGRFLIEGGSCVTVAPAGDAANACPAIYGVCLAVLASHRGLVSLHASGVQTPAGVAMFAAQSGSGKSTLAAAFANRGYEIVADDLCHMIVAPGRSPSVWPVLQQVRLWQTAVDALGWSDRPATPVLWRSDKLIFPGRETRRPALPVAGLFVLDGDGDASGISVDTLSGLPAVQAILPHLFVRSLLPALDREQTTMGQVVDLARALPIRRLAYPRRFDRLDAVIDRLEREFGALASATRR